MKSASQLSGDGPLAEGDIGVPDVSEPSGSLQLIEFKLPPPRELEESERTSLIKTSLARVWTEAQDSNDGASIPASSGSSAEMWMLLIVRMITRVAPLPEASEESSRKDEGEDAEPDLFARQDGLRQTLCDYIMSDFPSR